MSGCSEQLNLSATNIKGAGLAQASICGFKTEMLPLILCTAALFRSSLPCFQLPYLPLCFCLAHKCTKLPSVPWPCLLATKMMKTGTLSSCFVSGHCESHSSQLAQVLRTLSFVKPGEPGRHLGKIMFSEEMWYHIWFNAYFWKRNGKHLNALAAKSLLFLDIGVWCFFFFFFLFSFTDTLTNNWYLMNYNWIFTEQ